MTHCKFSLLDKVKSAEKIDHTFGNPKGSSRRKAEQAAAKQILKKELDIK